MSVYRIELALKAKKDMREIHAYITNNLKEPNIANKLLDKIEMEILKLRQMPFCHTLERDEQLKNRYLRKLIVDNYLVFYTVHEKSATVFVVRVLYARRDWVNLL